MDQTQQQETFIINSTTQLASQNHPSTSLNPTFVLPATPLQYIQAPLLPRLSDEELEYFNSFPPGYRFCPTDEELIVHYLHNKVQNQKLPPNKIMDVDIYKFNPEVLAETYKMYGEKEGYFFTPRDRKYKNGNRPNRAAGDGYWKATGADKPIKYNNVLVGYRKALVFHRGPARNGYKTNWIMHEYTVSDPPSPRVSKGNNVDNDMRLDDSVLCRIYKKCENFKTGNNKVQEPVDTRLDNEKENNNDGFGVSDIVALNPNTNIDSSASYEFPTSDYDFPNFSPYGAGYIDQLQPSEVSNYGSFYNSGISQDLMKNSVGSGISQDTSINFDASYRHSYQDQNAYNMVSLEKIFSRNPSNHNEGPSKQSPDVDGEWQQQQMQQSSNMYGQWQQHNAFGESQQQHQSTVVNRKRKQDDLEERSPTCMENVAAVATSLQTRRNRH